MFFGAYKRQTHNDTEPGADADAGTIRDTERETDGDTLKTFQRPNIDTDRERERQIQTLSSNFKDIDSSRGRRKALK